MVIADHNGAFKPNVQPSVRFTRPGAVMKEDSMDRWRHELCMQANAVELSSWDYRTRSSRPVSSSGAQAADADLVSRDAPGQYAYPSRSQGQCVADRQMQALEARQEVFIGAGTVRTLAPGTTFALAGHAVHDMEDSDDNRSFVVTRVVHLMNNNLSADLKANVAGRVGESALALMNAAEQAGSLHAIGNGKGERPLYRNRIDAIRVTVPYRTSLTGNDGRLLHPRPTSRGQQTAIVVGPPGAVIHTDRDHRVKVQFHWQRGAGDQMSHSRLNHPYPDGHVGAPGDDTAGTWVRVATPLAPIAGTNWGSVAVPRVGQEVLVDFLEGNIDRPVIVGAVYNGRGANDAQHNKVSHGAGVATGNAPAWFPGEAGAHAHPAVLSGIKSQAMRESQSGAGAYSQLVFDDSPGQARVALQRHASAHKGTDELNLGHLRHQVDNKRLAPIGFGAELKTEHNLALRGGDGLLVSADARNNGGGNQLDSHEPLVQLEQSLALQAALARTAQKHSAEPGRDAAGQGPDPTKLPAIDALERSINALKSTASAGRQADAASLERVTAYSEPLLQLSSPAGIVATSPANAVFVAGDVSNINAGQDINLVAEGANFHATKAGITLFTYGKASSKGKPNQETGIRLHAASGKVSSQSQSGETRITADKIITVASVTKHVKVESKRHVLLTAQGACLKLEGGNITVQAPGKVEFKATMKELAGPADASVAVTKLSKAKDIYNEAFVIVNEETKEPMAHVRYRLESSCGVRIEGFTDALGRTQRVFTSKSETLTLHLPKED
jgi:type VI secretion system secreted protein VgrG